MPKDPNESFYRTVHVDILPFQALNQIAPYITPPILRDSCQPAVLIPIRTVDIPNPIARCCIKVVRRAPEPYEWWAGSIDLVALLKARQQHIIRATQRWEKPIPLRVPRRLGHESREYMLHTGSVCLFHRAEARRAGFRGHSGEPVRVLWARLTAPREGNAAEPLAILAQTVVAANDRGVPVAPTGKSREGRREIGDVGEEWGGHLCGHVCGIVGYGA